MHFLYPLLLDFLRFEEFVSDVEQGILVSLLLFRLLLLQTELDGKELDSFLVSIKV